MSQNVDVQLTSNMEDYLEIIGQLKKLKGVARVKDIGEMMNVKNSSVNSALKNLSEKGLVDHEHYGYIELTQKGKKLAAAVQARHDLLTRFLVEILQVDEKIATEDACKMEHVISAETFTRLNKFLEFVDVNAQVNKKISVKDFSDYLEK